MGHSLHFGSVSMSGLPSTTTKWRTFENGRNVPGADIPTSAKWPVEYVKPFNHASGFLNVSVVREAPKNEIAAATMIR